ncbi:hypothetical protein BC939DRAFT_457328 [Gamsiella multidivaricata]|uniref:uncharacterized protein n=1 Tax=Gamsiella multidivaricata TaxID=101098 RepID=UPI0022203D77|nr:uncharacterized protein BC939DRAFT_457328 [Gamsiella multidivaricata]KAI7820674.1 hypothetical protein BC939DRAFT_457328 [Gamsiella multidivaricata]
MINCQCIILRQKKLLLLLLLPERTDSQMVHKKKKNKQQYRKKKKTSCDTRKHALWEERRGGEGKGGRKRGWLLRNEDKTHKKESYNSYLQ